MKEKITYTEVKPQDLVSVLEMGMKLWKNFEENDLKERLKKASESDSKIIFIAKNSAEKAVGFSFFSVRTDYVEAAKDLPTGYFEGIYIASEYRKLGVAKELVTLGEKWCKDKGCTQIASDTWLTATASRSFHKSFGYTEKEELVHFLKDI